jgi:peptide/nickel transport system substrate-binding protein
LSALTGASVTAASTSGSRAPTKTLIIDDNSDLLTLDPGREYEQAGGLLVYNMYETLLTVRKGNMNNPVPLLAASWRTSAGGRTFTFKLRRGVHFSDGTPLTSADVLFSFLRLKNVKGNGSFQTDGLTMTIPNKFTVIIHAGTPRPDVPLLITDPAFSVVNAKLVKANGGTAAANADSADKAEAFLNRVSAGSGPYILKSFSRTGETVLEKNPRYWGRKKPVYERVILRNVQPQAEVFDLLRGQAQVAFALNPAQAAGLTNDRFHVMQGPSGQVFFLFANADPAISQTSSNRDIWTAIRYALNYRALVAAAGKGASQPAGILPSGELGALPDSEKIVQDLDRARAAIEKSGVQNPTLKLEYASDLTFSGGVQAGPIAQLVQANLKAVGITVNITPAPTSVSLANWRASREELGAWDIVPNNADPGQFLVFCPDGRYGQRANWNKVAPGSIRRVCNQAEAAVGSSARRNVFERLQRLMLQESPFFPLIQEPTVIATARSVTGMPLPKVSRLIYFPELGIA